MRDRTYIYISVYGGSTWIIFEIDVYNKSALGYQINILATRVGSILKDSNVQIADRCRYDVY